MKRLFIGGYAHGQVHDIPEDTTVWNVPVPPRQVFTALEDSAPWVGDMTVDRYELRDIYLLGGSVMRVFTVRGGRPSHGFVSALIHAAGLDGAVGR